MKPRGIRNNNPGNIRRGERWEGIADVSLDQEFVTFKSPVWGIRAMARILLSYQKLHFLGTITGMISRWAPPSENDTDSYIHHVCKMVGVGRHDTVTLAEEPTLFAAMVRAIILHENGKQPYSDKKIAKGIKLAME